jgi:ribosomal protein S18 acetylase RimI-like enzyme
MVQIRRLGSQDVPEVVRAARLFDEPPDPAAVHTYLRDDRNIFLLASEGDTPVGYLRGTELGQLKNERRQLFLYEVAVAEERRRQGVGRELVRALLRSCEVGGFEEIFVFTDDPANVAAERLYRSTGAITETVGDRMFVYKLR